MLTATVALAVGAIPEGLPAAVTITLAIGVNRMARRSGVVRRMPAVETLGSTTVVCSDKTGTLTENQMTVRTIWTRDERFEVTGSGYQPEGAVLDRSGGRSDPGADEALRWTLIAGASCNDACRTHTDETWGVLGDPTEGALLVAAAKAGVDTAPLAAALPRVATLPFSSDRKYMATLHADRDGGRVILVKGAVERLLELCSTEMAATGALHPLDAHRIADAAEGLAARRSPGSGDRDCPRRRRDAVRRGITARPAHVDRAASNARPTAARRDRRGCLLPHRGNRREDDHG